MRIGIIALLALPCGLLAQEPQWASLSAAARNFLQDRYFQNEASWSRTPAEIQQQLLAAAEKGAATRQKEVESLAALQRQTRSFPAWDAVDWQQRQALVGVSALRAWLKDGEQLARQIYHFRKFRAHAAVGALSAKDLDWAEENLTRDYGKIAKAWQDLQSAQKSHAPPMQAFLAKQALAAAIGQMAEAALQLETGPDAQLLGNRIELDTGRSGGAGFLNDAIAKMCRSGTAHEVLADVIRNYEAEGRKPVVSMGQDRRFAKSRVLLRHGVQSIRGGPIESADTERGRANVNPVFLQLPDRTLAAYEAATSLAHEFEHLRLAEVVRRTAPRFGQVLHYDQTNERSARLVEWLAALELDESAHATMDTEELRRYARDPDWYWEDLKLESSYLLYLDLRELAEPLRAYENRLARIDKIIMKGGLSGPAQASWKERQEALRKRLDFLQTAPGVKLTQQSLAASQDPAYQALLRKALERERALWRLLFTRESIPPYRQGAPG